MGVRRLLGVVAMALGLLLTSPATSFAQGADDQRLAMANELFELTLGGELRGLFSGFVDEMIAEDPSFEDDHAAWMRANMPALMEARRHRPDARRSSRQTAMDSDCSRWRLRSQMPAATSSLWRCLTRRSVCAPCCRPVR